MSVKSTTALEISGARVGLGEILHRISLALPIRGLGAVAAFTYSVALARWLGADGVGLYYLASNVCLFGAVVGRLGLDNAAMRLIAAHADAGDWSAVRGVHRSSLRLAIGASLAAASAIFMAAPYIADHAFDRPDLSSLMRWMSLGIAPFALLNLQAEMLKAVHRVGLATAIQSVGVPLFALPIFYALVGRYSVAAAVGAQVGAQSLVCLVATVALRRALSPARGVMPRFPARILLATAGPLFWVALMNVVLATTDGLMLGYWLESGAVGLFSTVSRLVLMTGMLLVVVNGVVAPRFAVLHHRGDYEGLTALLNQITAVMALLACGLLGGMAVFAEPILSLFGPEFVAVHREFLVLLAAQLLVIATGPVAYLLMMVGRGDIHRNIVAASALLNVVLNSCLIPVWGMLGAALATGASLACKNVLAILLARRHLRRLRAASTPLSGGDHAVR